MSLVRFTASGLIAAALPLAAALVSVPLYLSELGAARYGILVLLLALLNYSTSLDLGVGKAVAFFLARRDYGSDPTHAGTIVAGVKVALLLSAIPALATLPFSTLLADWLPAIPGGDSRELPLAAAFALLSVPAMALMTVMIGAYQGLQRFFVLNAIVAGSGVALQILPLIACLIFGARLDIALVAVFASRVATVLLMALLLRDNWPLQLAQPGKARSHRQRLLGFGKWQAALNLLANILTTGDRVIVSAVGGATAVTAYSIPFDLMNRLMIIASSVSNTLFPVLATDAASISGRVARAGDTTIALLTPISASMILVLHPFMSLWVGTELADQSWMIGEIIALGVWFTATSALLQARLMAEGRGHLVAASYTAQLVPFFVVAWGATLYFGLIGTAMAWTLRCVADAGIMLRLSGNFTLLKALARHGIVLALALVGAAASTWLQERIVLLVFLGSLSMWLSRSQILLVIKKLRHS